MQVDRVVNMVLNFHVPEIEGEPGELHILGGLRIEAQQGFDLVVEEVLGLESGDSVPDVQAPTFFSGGDHAVYVLQLGVGVHHLREGLLGHREAGLLGVLLGGMLGVEGVVMWLHFFIIKLTQSQYLIHILGSII